MNEPQLRKQSVTSKGKLTFASNSEENDTTRFFNIRCDKILYETYVISAGSAASLAGNQTWKIEKYDQPDASKSQREFGYQGDHKMRDLVRLSHLSVT